MEYQSEGMSRGVSRREFLGMGVAAAGLVAGALFARPSLAAEGASAAHDGEVTGASASASASAAKDAAATSGAKDAAAASSAKDKPAASSAVSVNTQQPMAVDRAGKAVYLELQVTEGTTTQPTQVLTALESATDGAACVLRSLSSDLEAWDGLQAIGAEQGSKVTLTLKWGKNDELPIEQCLTPSAGTWAPDFTVSGSRDGVADPTGDIVALTSSETALVSDASVGSDVTFTGNPDVLPAVGTNVTLIIRLA